MMRNKSILILAAVSLLMLIPFVSVLEGAEATSAAATNYSIQGYVSDINWVPMEDVAVSIMDGQGKVYNDHTDATGFFSVSVPSNTGLSISFSAFGYVVVTYPNILPPISDTSNYRPLDLSKATYSVSTSTYTITGSIASAQCAIMKISLGTVKGHVTSNSNPIRGSTVTLTPADATASVPENNTLTATTNAQGYYELTCPVGNYALIVSGQGFKQSDPVPVTISSGPLTIDVTLEEKNVLKKYFGMDTAHLLMLIGVIVGIILAVVAWFLSRRVNKPHGLEIIDDSVDENEDVRYP